MSWGEHAIDGKSFDLRHLDPFVLTVVPKGQVETKYHVLVSFGSHTFTREISGEDPESHHFVDGSDPRCFCPIRYGYSLFLPDMIRRSAAGRVFFSEGRNMLCLDWIADVEAPYAAFFNLVKYRAKGIHAAMFVVSAYEKPNLPDRLPAMTFATLVARVVKNHPIAAPKDLRSIKR